MEQTQPKKQYHVHYGPAGGRTRVDFDELWRYKDLIWLFVKRDFTVLYKQTVLGPAWILINPLMSTAMYCVMFGTIAHRRRAAAAVLPGRHGRVDLLLLLHQQGVGHIYHQLQHLQQSVFSAAGHAHFHNAVRVHQLPGAVRDVLLPAAVLRGARRGGPQLGGYAAAASHRAAGGPAGPGLRHHRVQRHYPLPRPDGRCHFRCATVDVRYAGGLPAVDDLQPAAARGDDRQPHDRPDGKLPRGLLQFGRSLGADVGHLAGVDGRAAGRRHFAVRQGRKDLCRYGLTGGTAWKIRN